jgi:hypothetical protein
MSDRIHRALDGELPPDSLVPEERAVLHRYRAVLGTALEPMRGLPAIDVAPAVLQRAGRGQRSFLSNLTTAGAWLWSPRSFTLRPALALAGALAVAAAISTPVLQHTISPAAASPTRVVVQFRLADTTAREVALIGDFNGWQPGHRLHPIAAGVWAVDVALAPGVYNYVFVVDGTAMRLDPLAPRVTDGFGGASSRVAVLAAAARS